ncbi:MAG: hypothetical protein MUF54_05470 [Polyangiaceae bacterium]|jgi:hypothetical protein|nr:hypothetical protein [Polyangiaceae bacterium]
MRALGAAAALLLVSGIGTLALPSAAQPDASTPAGAKPNDAEPDTAEPCTEDPHECGRKAFAAGVQAFQAGDWPTALAQFREAYRLRPHPAVALNVALAEMRNNLYVEAIEHLRGIIQNPEASEELREDARREIDHASRGVAVLELDVAGDARVTATVDGARMLGSPPSMSLNPGTYAIEVRSANRLVLRRTVRLGVGEKLRVAVEVARDVKVVVPTTTATSKPLARDKLEPLWFLSGAGLTALLGGATIWSGLDTQRAFDKYRLELPDLTQEEINSRVDEGNNKELRTNLLFGATVLMAAGTAVVALFFTDWEQRAQSERTSLSVGLGSLWVQGRF